MTSCVATNMEFLSVPIAKYWDAAKTLTFSNFAEVGELPVEQFGPQIAPYEELERSDNLRTYIMLDSEKNLVGYALFILTSHLHFPGTKWAMQDVIYVCQKHRGRAALRFMLWIDEQLKSEGANYIYRHVEAKNDYSRTLEAIGYRMIERGFLRAL